jgi:hypothetical protein
MRVTVSAPIRRGALKSVSDDGFTNRTQSGAGESQRPLSQVLSPAFHFFDQARRASKHDVLQISQRRVQIQQPTSSSLQHDSPGTIAGINTPTYRAVMAGSLTPLSAGQTAQFEFAEILKIAIRILHAEGMFDDAAGFEEVDPRTVLRLPSLYDQTKCQPPPKRSP